MAEKSLSGSGASVPSQERAPPAFITPRADARAEITTHNIYFHEDSPVLSLDALSDVVATCGCDKVIRLWKMELKDTAISENVCRTAANSSVSLSYLAELGGFNKPINCVRFCRAPCSDGYLLAACADSGRVIVYDSGAGSVIRTEDGDDAYELCWGDGMLFVGFASGKVEAYAMGTGPSRPDEQAAQPKMDEENASNSAANKDDSGAERTGSRTSFSLVCAQTIHKSTVQGISYSHEHRLLATHSLDKTVKLHRVVVDAAAGQQKGGAKAAGAKTSLKLLSAFDEGIDNSRGLFKRLLLKGSRLYAFTKQNMLSVFAYPFRAMHLQQRIGPLRSSVVKVLEDSGYFYICTKQSLYIIRGQELVVSIDASTFLSATDACLIDGVLLISSMDGFVTSVRLGAQSAGL
ncbi:chromatin assembly factor 1 subunit B [Pancytospora philotis]|nr:chromatin assembly factor 1 subunit B [Pancytospora philotis]